MEYSSGLYYQGSLEWICLAQVEKAALVPVTQETQLSEAEVLEADSGAADFQAAAVILEEAERAVTGDGESRIKLLSPADSDSVTYFKKLRFKLLIFL